MKQKWVYFLCVFGLGLFLDQITKHWALKVLRGRSIPLWRGILELRLRENVGSAFGLVLLGRSGILVITVGLSIAFIVWMIKNREISLPFLLGSSFFLAGAWGNLLDRFRWGYVVDFIEPSFWATFNLGDVLILGGVFLLAYRLLLHGKT
ncbi:MAG: signal peptidase II [Candidatus Atribacteria bacterium]|nr:signal peptidase II [Candidatus Atribacteria bacterium]